MRFVNIKTIIPIIIILILLFLIKNIAISIISLQSNSHIVSNLKSQETIEKQQEAFLQQRLYYVNTPEFIENQAREKLGLTKEGEHIVLAPPISPTPQAVAIIDNTPTWQKWWKLFF